MNRFGDSMTNRVSELRRELQALGAVSDVEAYRHMTRGVNHVGWLSLTADERRCSCGGWFGLRGVGGFLGGRREFSVFEGCTWTLACSDCDREA